MTTSHWTSAMVSRIAPGPGQTAPVIAPGSFERPISDLDLWDLWPVQSRDGRVARVAGGALFMLLSAPVLADPEARHGVARIRLMHRIDDEWRDLGPALAEGFAPGSRQWAGSAVLSDDGIGLTLYFTAAGHRGERIPSFAQRLFETSARLTVTDGRIALEDWTPPVESVVADDVVYLRDMAGGGAIGTIKAFRDPAYFRDPADGTEYLVFTGSLAQSTSKWNGAIGIARREEARWTLGAPLIAADGVNNELERPHIVVHDGRYYLFWSTQRKVFAAGGPAGPTGLYGMVADRLAGPWSPLNGTGLVLANPAIAPTQAFSWLVLADRDVLSFVDLPGLSAPPSDTATARAHFGGAPAPVLHLDLQGDRATLAARLQ